MIHHESNQGLTFLSVDLMSYIYTIVLVITIFSFSRLRIGSIDLLMLFIHILRVIFTWFALRRLHAHRLEFIVFNILFIQIFDRHYLAHRIVLI